MSVLPSRLDGARRRLAASFRPPPRSSCRAITWLMDDPLFQRAMTSQYGRRP